MGSMCSNKFNQGIIYNYFSLVIMALSGFFFNIIILRFYDAAALGLFNQTYAWYVVLSQIASMGVHTSALSYLSGNKNQNEQGTILKSALLVTFLSSVIVVMSAEIAVSLLLDNRILLLKSMRLVLPALIFFSVNKVLLNYYNAIDSMKLYALFQSFRYLLIACMIVVISIMNLEPYFLSLSFLMAETVLIVPLAFTVAKKETKGKVSVEWIIRHLKFGVKVFPANMVLELNAKIDVLCLGIMLKDDYAVGIYSFASIFANGLYEAYVVVRRSINPELAKADEMLPLQDIIKTIYKKLQMYLYVLLPAVFFVALAVYKILCIAMRLGNEYDIGILIVLTIGVSVVVTGKMVVLGNIFSQAKFPEIESLLNMSTVLVNGVFNIVFIFLFGVWGAALGTAISYVFFGVALKALCRKKLGILI